MLRYYHCPVVSHPILGYCPKIGAVIKDAAAPINWHAAIPSAADGTPKRSWALVMVHGADLTLLDNDPECVEFLEKRFDNFTTKQGLYDHLRTTTFGGLPKAVRTRVLNRLTAIGVPTATITTSTLLWDVLQLVATEVECDLIGIGCG